MKNRLRILVFSALLIALCVPSVRAQDWPAPAPSSPQPDRAATVLADAPVTIFPHPESSRYWISGQANIVLQWHPSFRAAYTGPNSLRSRAENATSKVYTLYTGLKLTNTTEVFVDIESAGGHGISDALGLSGFTNLDVVRNPDLGATPYLARFLLRQIIPLSRGRVSTERGPFGLATSLPARRIEFRIGKFSMVDFFDANSAGSDSHLQFLNWTVDNNGAYDYAANTRGYTDGAMLEYHDGRWAVRFAEGLMPKVANGIHLDADLTRAHAENIEFELHGALVQHKQGVLRVLGFVNHANMGSYREAVDNFLAGRTRTPDITAHPLRTTIKYGFGVNFEQPLNEWMGVFGRWGWNEGRHESYAYTEVDQTVLIGVGGNGKRWQRGFDRAGIAFVSNGISRDHQEYLALGGVGFLLGDGRLNYGRENIVEAYYTLHVWRGIYPSFSLQHINNPGYNRDRGPVWVPALRLHVEF